MCFRKKAKPEIVEPEKIKPTSIERISLSDLTVLLSVKFPATSLYLSDYDFLLCSPNDIALFLAQNETNKMGYVAEKRDCDDFAYRLMGDFSIPEWSDLCLGIMWTDNHAFNLFVTEEREILFIEPQTDEISETIPLGGTPRIVVI